MNILKITFNAVSEKKKEVIQTILSTTEILKKEQGCLSYDVFVNIKEENIFNIIQEWKTRKDMSDYICSEKFRIILGIKSLLYKPIGIKIYTVSHTEGKETCYSLREEQRYELQ